MIPNGKAIDLLEAKPILSQIQKSDYQVVLTKVAAFISKAAMQVGTDLTPDRLELMAEDLIDSYKYDSLEDIREALKKGRQGRYGKIYGKLNGLILSEWMNNHLESKAAAREQAHSKKKEHLTKEQVHQDYVKIIENIEDPKKKFSEAMKLSIRAQKVIHKHSQKRINK